MFLLYMSIALTICRTRQFYVTDMCMNDVRDTWECGLMIDLKVNNPLIRTARSQGERGHLMSCWTVMYNVWNDKCSLKVIIEMYMTIDMCTGVFDNFYSKVVKGVHTPESNRVKVRSHVAPRRKRAHHIPPRTIACMLMFEWTSECCWVSDKSLES